MSRNKQRNKELSLTSVGGRLSLFLDSRAPRAVQDAVCDLGICPILLPVYDKLPIPVAAHPDLLLHDLGGRLLVYRAYYEENKALFSDFAVILTDHTAGNVYPCDVGMDALVLKETVFCLPEYTCPEILQSRVVVPVRQGYAACAALKVNENAIITADPSIVKAAEQRGISVLVIAPGHIELHGYDYGFIGGTAFQMADTLYFAGDLSLHPDGERIADFGALHGMRIHSLVPGLPLQDLGFLKYNKKSM